MRSCGKVFDVAEMAVAAAVERYQNVHCNDRLAAVVCLARHTGECHLDYLTTGSSRHDQFLEGFTK